MNATAKTVSDEALKLPVKSRDELADLLLSSLEEFKNTNYDSEWLSEVKKRDLEISNGTVECRTHSEVMKSAIEAL